MAGARTIAPGVFYRTARASLARLACEYADPTATENPHDHAECLVDDESLTADLLLRLSACIASQDPDSMLDMLTHLTETVTENPT